VVEAELAFFELQVKGDWVHSSEPRQSCFGVPQKPIIRQLAVDVIAADGATTQLVCCVIDPYVLLVAHVNQFVVALGSV